MAQVNATSPAASSASPARTGRRSICRRSRTNLDQRIIGLRAKFGEIGDTRLTVMAALMVADELSEASAQDRRLEEEATALQDARMVAADRAKAASSAVARCLQLGGRAHRGHHQEGSTPRSATAWRSDDALTPDA